MFKKVKKQSEQEMKKVSEDEAMYEHPMVCLLDCNKKVEDELKRLKFSCFSGTLGAEVEVKNTHHEKKFMKLNFKYPKNFHEYDIILLDFTNKKSEKYDPVHHNLNYTSGTKFHALLSQYPEQIFNPIPFTVNIISNEIRELINKKSIVITFCGHEDEAEYKFVEITPQGANITSNASFSSLNFYKNVPHRQSRHGKKSLIPENRSKLTPLLQKHLGGIKYSTVFSHPNVLKGNSYQKDPTFFPLLTNERKEIISYAHFVDKLIIFVFPDIKEKVSFVSDLFKTYLPDVIPEIFPFHGEFGWLTNGDYLLPGEQELLDQKNEIEKKYIIDVRKNKESIAKLKNKFKFLSDMISESGENLVSAVEKYLKWLEFESVVNFDETNPDILEEDIQIDYADKFLVIEVKGLGGTSTDKDCYQISKIRYRRAEQRGKFDVFGLYIVNHQRYMPPESRKNPPFSENQIKDAGLDNRGLLTTYELYKAYFLIEAKILSKEAVRNALFKTGLISLAPTNLISMGIPQEYFKNGKVAIVNINGCPVNKGDILLVKKQNTYFKVTVESLMLNDVEVERVDTGEVGIKFSQKLRKNSELFIEKADSNGFIG